MAWKNNQDPYIPIVEVISVGSPMTHGRNAPLKMFCQDQNNGTDTYVVKLWNTPELPMGAHCLAKEVYGSLLAGFFGLNTPDIAAVNVDSDFSSGIPDPKIRKRISQSPGLNFGSRYLSGKPLFSPPATSTKFHEAGIVFCFDMLIGNYDRTYVRPNLLDAAEGLILIDHEMAFPFSTPSQMLGGCPVPWDHIRQGWPEQHVLYSSLKGKECALEIEDFIDILVSVDDSIFVKIEESIPDDWITPELHQISSYLAATRDNAGLFKRSLQEILV